MIELSYIIPFYNGGKSVLQLMDSIYASGLDISETEIIVVDDKSSDDKSVQMLHAYVQERSNIRIIRHEKNLRQGGAKNTGIRAAMGRYIALADQDDIIPGKGIVNALKKATETGVDMLACRYIYQYSNGERKEYGWPVYPGYTGSGKEFCETYFDASVCVCPWEYLYRREFLLEQNHPFAENVLLEASDWVEWHLINAKQVAYCPEQIYQWNIFEESTSHQRTAKHAAAWVSLGYRKIEDSKRIRTISSVYAGKVLADGKQNVEGTMLRLWKTTGYSDFFPALGDNLLRELQKIQFSPRVNRMLNYPKMTLCELYLWGSVKRFIREMRDKLKR
jgi:glycosyltransferase involved in cell wall biosynthesis